MKRFIGFEVPNGSEELLMPNTEKNPAAFVKIIKPFRLVFHSQAKSSRIDPDKGAKEIIDTPGNNGIAILL
jgi:hypothetical protein